MPPVYNDSNDRAIETGLTGAIPAITLPGIPGNPGISLWGLEGDVDLEVLQDLASFGA